MASMVKTTVSAFRDSVHSLSEHFERKFTEIVQKLNRLAADRVDSVNQNANRSMSLFDQMCRDSADLDAVPQNASTSQSKRDNQPSLFAHSNQGCTSSISNTLQNP